MKLELVVGCKGRWSPERWCWVTDRGREREVLHRSRKLLLLLAGWDYREDRGGTKQRRQQQAGRQRVIHHNVDPTEQDHIYRGIPTDVEVVKTKREPGPYCFFFSLLARWKWRSWRAAVCAPRWAFCPAESWLASRSWRKNFRDGDWQAAPASTRRICSDILAVSTPLSSPTTVESGSCPVSLQPPPSSPVWDLSSFASMLTLASQGEQLKPSWASRL